MKKLEGIVKVSENCLNNIMRNIIEQKDNESIGDIIGKKEGKEYIAINAYPWQKAYSGNENAGYKDFESRMRVINTDIDMREELMHFIIGQYHSHIFKPEEKRETRLGKEDIEFFTLQGKWLEIPELLEIVASVRIKNYKNKPRNKISFRNYESKLRVIWRSDSRGYDVIFGAYKISKGKEQNPEELQIRKI